MSARMPFLCGMASGLLLSASAVWFDRRAAPIPPLPGPLVPTQWMQSRPPPWPRTIPPSPPGLDQNLPLLNRLPTTEPRPPFDLYPGDFRIPTTEPKELLDSARPFFFNGQRVYLLPLKGHPSVSAKMCPDSPPTPTPPRETN